MIVDSLISVFAAYFTVEQIWILSRGVVTPNRHLGDCGDWLSKFLGDLADRTIVVQTGHRCEATGIQSLGILLSDQSIGVGGVTDHKNFDVALGTTGQRLALRLKNASIGAQKVCSLHTSLAGHSAHEKCYISVSKGHIGIIGTNNTCQ